ncbi:site-specific integrase [Ruminococcus sp. AM36-2AA]|nr:site-specific integrase [Ruminococcus sp. AM36-5]RGH62305.1 site-specific integrase [Ruminococcus sp. AM36-2AA]
MTARPRREKGTGSWDTVTKNGITYYRYRKKYDGMTSRKEFVARTKADVKHKIKEYESKTMHITNRDYLKMTLGECVDIVLESLESTFKTNNYATLQSTNRCYIKTNKIADVQMGSVDPVLIQNYYTELSKKYSESTVKKTRTLFNTVFDYLVSINIMTANPAKGIKMPHKTNYAVQKKEHSFLSLEQAEKFKEAALMKADETIAGVKTGDYIYGRNARFCLIVLYTGMRIGEAYALTWDDVNFKRNVIRINKSMERIKINGKYQWITDTPKKPASIRVIPMSNIAKEQLLYLKMISPGNAAKGTDTIFVTDSNIPPSQSSLTRTLKAILTRAEINPNGFGLHDLRHSFGSMLLEKGWETNHPVDIKVISELLGHDDVSTTYNTYLHIINSHKSEVVNLLI